MLSRSGGCAAGVALSENGAARANMGVDAADYDRSGRPHLVVGNFLNEMIGLYHNDGRGLFKDVAPRSEVGRASLLSVTWGIFFLAAKDIPGSGWSSGLVATMPRPTVKMAARQRTHRRRAPETGPPDS